MRFAFSSSSSTLIQNLVQTQIQNNRKNKLYYIYIYIEREFWWWMKMGREEDMEELSLELSIGGKYGRAENLKEKTTEFCGANADCEERSEFVVSRCDFSGVEAFDPQRRREIQALRRQEARRKREEKVKKSRGMNTAGFVEDKLFLEVQRMQARARDREIRERNCFFEGENRGNGRNCSDEDADGLGLSLVSEKKRKDECLYPKVQFASPVMECESEHSNGVKSLEQCSSAVSDYRSMSHKGESSSDTGSHSSHLRPRLVDQIESHDSSLPVKPAPNPTTNPQPNWIRSTDSSPSPDATTTSDTLSKETTAGPNDNPPKPCIPRMPCVSTTGNGPNGRTVSGFLYRYNKTEVSIMCVCHGRSFSPAEFVEHAGGVDVVHPLRHITVVPYGPPVAR